MARAGRGGGGGGGGRSSGSGGSRSSGGRSSSSSSSRSGYNSSPPSSRPSSGGGFGGGFSPRPPRGPMYPPPPPPRHYYGGRYRPRSTHTTVYAGGSPRRSAASRIVSMLTVFVLVFAIFFFVSGVFRLVGSSNASITRSTIEREPLPASALVETGYFTDELGWIGSSTKLETGMKNFKDATGVQPYLYITDNLNGKSFPNNSEIDYWANDMYDELFKDEAHMFVLFLENDDGYSTWYVCGTQAKTVIDSEAADILLDCIDRYYYSDMEDEEYFAKAFDDAAKRIMTVEKSPWPTFFIIAAVIVLLLVLLKIWKRVIAQKNLEAEQTERILNTPIEQIDPGDDPLSKKYDDM